jgi:hypothetical protein
MRQTVLFFILLAVSASWVQAQEHKDLRQLLKAKGPPAFTAKSIEARGNLLVCQDLELFDPDGKNATEKLRGRVLLICEPWDALWLWAAHIDLRMRRATPFLGQEGAGKTCNEVAAAKMKASSKLLKPAKVFAAVVGKTGAVMRTTEVTVHELQCKD